MVDRETFRKIDRKTGGNIDRETFKKERLKIR